MRRRLFVFAFSISLCNLLVSLVSRCCIGLSDSLSPRTWLMPVVEFAPGSGQSLVSESGSRYYLPWLDSLWAGLINEFPLQCVFFRNLFAN